MNSIAHRPGALSLPARGIVISISLVAGGWAPLAGQDPVRPDSTRPINLGEIVVRETGGARVAVPFSEQRISLATIQQRDAAVVADFARLIPAASIQTNSRGETLVYLRGAGERQVAVFFEGALLNVPWDNRVDLSMIPTSAIGGMTVAQGVPPMEYGANVLGGAINFTARRPEGNWSESFASARYGSGGQFQASASHGRRNSSFSYTGAFSYARASGRTVAADAALPFSQLPGELRTNTDYEVSNVYTSGVFEVGDASRMGITFLHMEANKGIAPEGHVDPAMSRVRFWRYPDWSHTTTIVHGEGVGARLSWKGAAWATGFTQDIDDYVSANYNIVGQRQEDSDLTLGSRVVGSVALGRGVGKIAVNALTSRHRQRDVPFDLSGNPLVGGTNPRLVYRQHTISLGAEYGVEVTDRWDVSVGGSFDAMGAPETGDKPSRDAFTDYSATAGATYTALDNWFFRAAVGRKTRFPTMRELFGEALNRFLLNPSLRPESSVLTELAIGKTGTNVSGEIIPFGRFTSGTIDQVSVTVPGETRPRRQRVNLQGSDVIGVEVVGTVLPADGWHVEGHLTVMRIRRRKDMPTDSEFLSEKPGVLSRVGVTRDWESGLSALVEGVYTGRAYSPDDNNQMVPLDPSLVLNLRVEQLVEFTPWQTVRVFGRADNVLDAVVVPQLGLPDQGRAVSAGFEFSF